MPKLFNPKVSYKKKKAAPQAIAPSHPGGKETAPMTGSAGQRLSCFRWCLVLWENQFFLLSNKWRALAFDVVVVTLPLSLTPRMLGNRKSRVGVLFHSFISLLLSQSDSLSAFACCLSFLFIVLIHLPHPFPDTFKTFMDIAATLGQIWLQKTLHVAWYLIPFLNHWNLLTFRKSKKNLFILVRSESSAFCCCGVSSLEKPFPHLLTASASCSVWRDTVLRDSLASS